MTNELRAIYNWLCAYPMPLERQRLVKRLNQQHPDGVQLLRLTALGKCVPTDDDETTIRAIGHQIHANRYDV